MSENLIFFQGKTQYENTGDVLINKSLIQLLRKHGNIIINDVGMPSDYVNSITQDKEERISSFQSSFAIYLLKQAFFNRKDKVFLIAGPPGHLFGNSTKKSIRNLVSAFFFFILSLVGVKIIKIGFSIGPIGVKLSITERIRAAFTHFYLVRDSISLSLSNKIGIKKASFFPDLAWMYNVFASSNENTQKIILSFRDSIYEGKSDDEYLNNMILSLCALLQKIDKSFIIEITYQVKRDYAFSKKLYKELKDHLPIIFNETQVTLENANEYYNGVHSIITNRLHGALLAYKYGALPIILTDLKNHLKIKGIFQDAGVDTLILDINNNTDQNVSNFIHLLNDREKIIHALNLKTIEYERDSTEILNKIFKKK